MSVNKADIQQIQKYLNGELDAKAMHALEKQAQNDPFLMDAIEGYQNTGTAQHANFNQLKQRFALRTGQSTQRHTALLRPVLPVAATLLIVLGIGFLWLKPQPKQTQLSKIVNTTTINKTNTAKVAKPGLNGIVTDPTGHPLANVRVAVKGTRQSTRTDTLGRFNIPDTAAKGILNIAATGYDAKQVKLRGKTSLNIVLNESPTELASVSVTAYVEDDKPANKAHPAIGWKAFKDYLRKNAFVETGETGLVKLAFTVGTDGIINGIHVIHGKDETMNQRAIDLVLNGPEWKGINNTQEMHLKILFRKAKES